MKFYDEAPWVFDKSPHTGHPKTMHCIPVLPFDHAVSKPSGEIVAIIDPGEYIKSGWKPKLRLKVGGEYCVKSEQRARALGRIKVLRIARCNTRSMLATSILACGSDTWVDFVEVWAHRHDTKFYDREILGKHMNGFKVLDLVNKRPDHLYTAWAITFAPVP